MKTRYVQTLRIKDISKFSSDIKLHVNGYIRVIAFVLIVLGFSFRGVV